MRKTRITLLILALCCLVNFVSAQCPGLTLAISPDQTIYCGTPATINLSNNSSGPQASTATYEWFNGGTSFNTTVGTGNVTNVVGTTGTVNYTIIATDTTGCQDTITFSVDVVPLPIPSFTFAPNSPCTDAPIIFANTSTNTLPATTYFWDFGDGNTSTQQNPLHSFAPPAGNYTVTLVVTNPSGCSDSVSQVVTVLPSPVANITANPLTFCLSAGDTSTTHQVTFFNSSTNGVSYDWDFGDGSPVFTTNSQTPFAYTYTQFGTFNVVMTATGANGCTSTDSVEVIFDRLVSAAFQVPLSQGSGCAPHDVTPINLSLNGTTFTWDWGDGSPPTITNNPAAPTHTYTVVGNYTITLIATNACGTSQSTVGPIIISEPPLVSFVMATPPFCAPADVSFFNTSTGASPANNYTWSFGRGVGDTLAGVFIPPNQTYNQGLFTVTLEGTNGCGTSSFSLPLFVDSIPIANVLATPDEGCNPLGVVFVNTSSDIIDVHSWSLFGGLLNFSTYQIPPQVFPAIGTVTTHNVNYTISNFCGSDDTTIVITVRPEAVAAFSASTLSICAGDSVTFNDLSTGGVIGWDWNFGNGNNSTAQGPHTQIYNTPGLIPVTLTVDNGFCTSSFVQVIEVRPNPVAGFATVPDSACVPAVIGFTNNSTPLALHTWTFAGGAIPPTATGFTPPPVTFPVVGTHEVTLTVDLNGCIRRDTQNVVVMPSPSPSFTVTPQDGCSPLTVSVNNTSIVTGGETWFWDFGDGTNSTLQNPPPHTYTNNGTTDIIRTITLTVTTDFGCVSSVSIPVTIHPLPVAGFNATATTCLGETVNFTNTSTGASTFNWDFGDGNTSTQTNPSHIYTATGTFTVELISITAFGCRDTVTQTIQVDPIPSPAFSADTVCANSPTTFTDQSTGGVVGWQWDFGDGNTSNAQNPVHLYAGPGTFNVQLIVTNNLGCSDSITLPVIVRPNPVAGFTAPAGACLGEIVPFTNTSTGALTYNWNFGDGNTSTQTNPTHSYGASGSFTIELIAANSFGCEDTFTQVILIDTIPVPNFSADTVCLGSITSFTDLSTPPPSVTAWIWDFGDGNSSTLQNPTHLYAAPGTYNVQLVATNSANCSDTIVLPVVVLPVPTAAFSAPRVCLGEISTFTDLSTGSPVSFSWDFGDGNTSTLQNPTHLYATANTYSVTLILTNLEGCSDTLTQAHIVDEVPVAAFTADTTCFGAVTTFDATGSANSPNQFSWDFGDGNSDNTNNPTPFHLYGAPGNYTVTLIAGIAATGCADTTSLVVIVNESPVANFSADTVCQGSPTTFTDQSTNNFPDTWDWDFGDGNSSSLQNPIHLYTNPGTFNVTLIVTNSLGCSDTISLPVEVNPVPVAAFSAPNVCFGSNSIFTDNSIGNPIVWDWNFGDGNGSTLQNPVHSYAAPGTYNITLIVTNSFGCEDTLTGTHTVDPTPVAVFAADTVCFGQFTSFDATASTGGPNTFFWDFGDGNTDNSNNPTPTHTYASPGTFSVTLVAGFGGTGCTDTATFNVVVHETPIAAFAADTVCLNGPTTFSDLSTNNFPGQWTWDFGDGNSSSLQNPTHLYGAAGTFTVQLIVENTFGCIDSVSNPVLVGPLPTAGFTVQPQACVGSAVPVTNTSTGGVIFNWDFGDGNTSTLTNPIHSYASGGIFTIELIAITGLDCRDTVTQTIVVDTLPLPNFTADTVCVGNVTTFIDQSIGSVNNYDWDFGDGNSSTLQNPTHLYAAPGTFNVTLVVSDGPGCQDSITIPVLVNPVPVAAFTAPAVCFTSPSLFTDNSSGTPISWDWDFGDGNTSTLQNPSHIYAAPGSYTVTLIVFSGIGCSDTISATHDVFPIPTAIFTADTVCFGNATSFDATASIGSPNTYFWDYGDGNTDNSNNPSPTHVYATADTFTVTLIAGFGGTGCTDTTTLDVIVRETPVATFVADTVCLNLITTFTDQSTNNFPSQWTWDLGDGNSSTLQNPTHLYATAGTFTVQLTVENIFGCIDSVSNPVIVEPLPVAGFNVQAQACVGEVIPFANTSSGAATSNWDFGDGNSSTLTNPTHSYTAGGTFTVELIANTGFGCADTVTGTIVVDTIPVPNFIADTVCVGDITTFTDLSTGSVSNWDWDFADGNSSTLQNPTHLYANAGTFNVQLTITDGPGCQDSITIPVLVNPVPVAAFTAPAVCFTSPSLFTDNSSGTPISWDWDFGDGNTSTLQNPSHIYAAPGNYTVTLIVFSGIGCSDTISATHDVFPIPTAIFSADTVCFGNATSFDATASIGSPNTYFWDYGDGNTDNTNNPSPTHVYATADTFAVTLIAGFGGTGCTDTTTLDVIVRETPVAAFMADTVCLNLITTFTDQSTNNFPSQWTWDLGDGNSSPLQNPTHLYATTGTFTVQLTVENTFGCIDSISNPVVVEPLPVAGFNVQAQACVGEVIPFTNTSSGAATSNWDFGDGNSSTLTNPTHSYTAGGTFTVELIANTGFGCADTVTQTIVVDTIPVPNFVADTVCVGNITTFTDLSTGSVTNWNWDFADGNISTLQNPTHLYANAGTFNVQLTITDGPGCQDSITIPVLVNPVPVAAFTAPAVCFTSPSLFTDNSSGTPISWDWDFGDGNTSTLQNPSHIYAAPGNYTVTLIVFSGIGCSDTISATHDVFPIPTAIFTADTVCFGNATSFDATASIGSPNTYFWDYGDGNTDNTNNPTPAHVYATADTFTVTLIAGFGATGCTDTTTLDVIVRETPVATFVADTVCLNLITTFTDQSTNNFPSQWTWDLGDGNSSTLQNPTHLYATPGTFTVQLTVENIFGCIDSVTNPVIVEPLPVAGFTGPSGGCVGENIPFTNTSTGATNYNWDFGDGNTSIATNPTHVYSVFGNFTVELIAITGFGCRDTISQPITLDTLPVPGFVADTVCINNPTTFTDLSTGSVVSWDWDFGDGNSSTSQNPIHLYTNPGVYNVQLTVMNTLGCTDSLTIPVEVYPEPTAGFLAPAACLTSPSVFTDTSLGTPTVWNWDFGDGNGSNLQNPTHIYAAIGTYNVTLMVFSGVGCSDTITIAHTVHPIPTAIFTRDTVCFGDSTFFDATSSIGSPDTYFWDFGDGNFDNTNSATLHHTYSAAGTYTATLVAGFGSTGCTDTTTLNVIVHETPVAIFQADTVCLNINTIFIDQSTNNFPNSWTWDFGDGNGSNLQNPSHLYTTPDTFAVQLIVENTFGCIDSLTRDVIVNPLPIAAFSFDTVCLNLPTTFTDLSTDAANYDWDFGDGNGSTLASPSHVYAVPGTYTVTQIVFNIFGCSDTTDHQITVSPYPVADFSVSTACFGYATVFSDSSTGNLVSWAWDFGDSLGASNQPSPSYIYGDSGLFLATLVVTNNFGCTDTAVQPVTVLPIPVAGFSYPIVCAREVVQFQDTSLGLPSTWSWDFGDGSPLDTTQNPGHIYDPGGGYQVTLVAGNIFGCFDTLVAPVLVNTVPVPDFSAPPVCQGDLTQFTNLSTDTSINTMTYFWIFGDGNNSFVRDPGYVYADSGFFNVTLFTTNNHGCVDSITQPVYIAPAPNADFQATTVCLGEVTQFTDLSSPWVTGWSWDFGDGTTSNIPNPNHVFATSGNHTVTLEVFTANSCVDTIVQNLNVQIRPEASFTFSPVQCSGQAIDFESTSLNNPAVWSWDFGDGTTSSLENPSHSYATAGIYTVTLVASTPNACSDTATVSIMVFENPTAEFAVDTVCLGIPTFFENQSTGGVSYSWTFGNLSNSSTAEEPGYIFFDTSGVYNVTLVVTSPEGCVDTIMHPAIVAAFPQAGFISNPTIPASLTTDDAFLTFSNLSTGGLSYQWNFGDGATSTETDPTHSYDEPGSYCVSLLVTGLAGCQDSLELCTIEVGTGIPDIPNLFTPNGDGTNDNFEIRNISEFPNNSLVVFNRWGNKVYERKQYNNEWNGTNSANGKMLPDGAYYYIFNPGDGSDDVIGDVVIMK